MFVLVVTTYQICDWGFTRMPGWVMAAGAQECEAGPRGAPARGFGPPGTYTLSQLGVTSGLRRCSGLGSKIYSLGAEFANAWVLPHRVKGRYHWI